MASDMAWDENACMCPWHIKLVGAHVKIASLTKHWLSCKTWLRKPPANQTPYIKGPESDRRQEAPQTEFFFIGPSCVSHQTGFDELKKVKIWPPKKKLLMDQRHQRHQRPYKTHLKKSCQIQILRTPINWTWSRVGWIRSQIKKLIFLEI